MAHPVEKELLKATDYKPKRKFDNRQDYLGSVLNAVIKLTDDDFNNLTDEAAAWTNAAIEAKNAKRDEIPDFDEVDATDEDGEAEEEAEDADEASDDADESEDDSEPDEEADDSEDADDRPADDEAETDQSDDDEPEPAKKPKKAAPKRAPAKAAKPEKEKAAPKPAKKAPVRNDDDVVLDKWGAMQGSKNSQALALFEKGATAKEVKDKLGGTYYNVLKKVVQNGHKLEKDGAVITITHKDEGKKAAPAKKKK